MRLQRQECAFVVQRLSDLEDTILKDARVEWLPLCRVGTDRVIGYIHAQTRKVQLQEAWQDARFLLAALSPPLSKDE